MGTSPVLVKVGKAAVKAAGDKGLTGLWESTVGRAFTSFGTELQKSEAGRVIDKVRLGEYEPAVAKAEKVARDAWTSLFGTAEKVDMQAAVDNVANGIPTNNPKATALVPNIHKYIQTFGHSEVSIAPDLLEKDAKVALLDYGRKGVQQQAREKFLDNDTLTTAIVSGASERGNIYANNMADMFNMYFGDFKKGFPSPYKVGALKEGVDIKNVNSVYRPPTDNERVFTDTLGKMFLGRIGVAELFQGVTNSLFRNGISITTKAASDLFAHPKISKDMVAQSGAFEADTYFELLKEANGEGVISKILGARPGFSLARKFNTILNGLGEKYSALEWSTKLLNGIDSANAELNLKSMGIDPKEVMKNGGLSQEQLETAMYRGATEALFPRSNAPAPLLWQSSVHSRMASMYKNYVFSQGALIKKTFEKAAQMDRNAGNKIPINVIKKAALLGTVFPIFGSIMLPLENMATGNDPLKANTTTDEPTIDWYIDAMGHAGGFAMGYSVMRAAKRRNIAAYFGGPYTSLFDVIEDVANGNGTELVRDVVRKVPVVGPALVNLTKD